MTYFPGWSDEVDDKRRFKLISLEPILDAADELFLLQNEQS